MTATQSEREPWLQYTPLQRWLFLAVLMLVGTSAAVDKGLLPILFQPIKDEFQLSDGMLGLLGGAPFAICYALSSIPLARLADRGSRKSVLIAVMIGWSVMTALCGIAPTLLLLFICRMGVGLAEGGALPPSHALIAEYFPMRQRGLAFALFTATASIGYMLASSVGSWLEMAHGWRAAFLVTGLAALPAAVLALLILRESAPALIGTPPPAVHIKRDLQALFGKRTLLLVLIGLMFLAIYPYGLIVFTPTYMVRVFHMDLAHAGPLFGLSVAIGQLAGSIGGGALADRLRLRDERWVLWLPGIASVASMGIASIAFSLDNVLMFLVLGTVGIAAASSVLPPAFAVVQQVCGSQRRATASAFAVIVLHAIGNALAPILIGLLSDMFHDTAGTKSIRYAILTVVPLLIVAAWAFFSAAKSLQHDVAP